jgi:hypothetical protein
LLEARINSTLDMPPCSRRTTKAAARAVLALFGMGLSAAYSPGAESMPAPIYKAYSVAVAAPYTDSVSKLERSFHVVEAPGELSPPGYATYPEPFDIALRRGRTSLKVVAFVVLDSKGKVVQLAVIGASDMTVANVAGAKLSRAAWKPAKLGNVAVASAGIWEFQGAGLPN